MTQTAGSGRRRASLPAAPARRWRFAARPLGTILLPPIRFGPTPPSLAMRILTKNVINGVEQTNVNPDFFPGPRLPRRATASLCSVAETRQHVFLSNVVERFHWVTCTTVTNAELAAPDGKMSDRAELHDVRRRRRVQPTLTTLISSPTSHPRPLLVDVETDRWRKLGDPDRTGCPIPFREFPIIIRWR